MDSQTQGADWQLSEGGAGVWVKKVIKVKKTTTLVDADTVT